MAIEEEMTMLRDERALLDLLARFDDEAIRTDLVAFRSLWTEGAVWTIGEPLPMRAEGPEQIVAALKSLQKGNRFFFRMTGRPVFNILEDSAQMRSPTVELATRTDGHVYANVAFYEDLAVRGPGNHWRFQKREYRYLWVDTDSAASGRTVALLGDASIAEELRS